MQTLLPFLLAAALGAEARISNHLIVRDYPAAVAEAQQAFARKPSQDILELYIEALAKEGDEEELWKIWNQNSAQYPELKQKREVLEKIAWGVLNKGYKSASPLIRVQALVAAYFAQDSKGVELLLRGLHDPSAPIRKVAIKLSGGLRDAKLQDQILIALKTDKNYDVRVAAIEAIGEMHIHRAKPDLLQILAQTGATEEETEAAVASLIEMTDSADRPEVEKLVNSPRYGMRLLGCSVVHALESKRDLDLVEQLVNDPQPSVRAAALRTLGLLRGANLENAAQARLRDQNPNVAITAAWALTLVKPAEGQAAFEPWLNHEKPETRHLAAAALSGTGRYGLAAQKKGLRSHSDPLVRMNLAIGLITQREDVALACQELAKGCRSSTEKWELTEEASFKILRVSRLIQDDGMGTSREGENQMARLQVLNILAIMHDPGALEAVRAFLKQREWGISGMAAALLLTEGDESSLDLIEALVQEKEPKLSIQAALILALWGKSEKAIQTLQNSYASADRELKERILEGVGRVGNLASVPFLIERLQEPYLSLRILAAAALLECLYH